MNTIIVTGASRGIGKAMAERLAADDANHVVCISRTANQLQQPARGGRLDHIAFDLSRTDALDALMDEVFALTDLSCTWRLIWVNNAAVLAPLGPIEECEAGEIAQHVEVNLLAPMLLTSLFIKRTRSLEVDKRLLNISSASAKHLLPGMSCYSASKVALDVFTRCVALEQEKETYPVKVASVWPGMIDTDMQKEARTANFPSSGMFVAAQSGGYLTTPEYTAERLVELLFSESFGSEAVVEKL
ncbi:SDR family NAD(P)-dependent oxidoreductase [Paenibacillus ginsengarvi]|uniref:SDR family NAD(P)-dependent oxidoreductase n=1 Tax=Paenibacillus ginsengarvi TaxID=400777 RepID=A0A3B0C904_9BACL|nr:SDR family NAD(P)-dependent oxidoreductase [Paenibacillus ginsengarvi]RKN80477.1 SDR family NAD(P)-dependent oxidoreductase [Paenibacillus ginsengarvi]